MIQVPNAKTTKLAKFQKAMRKLGEKAPGLSDGEIIAIRKDMLCQIDTLKRENQLEDLPFLNLLRKTNLVFKDQCSKRGISVTLPAKSRNRVAREIAIAA